LDCRGFGRQSFALIQSKCFQTSPLSSQAAGRTNSLTSLPEQNSSHEFLRDLVTDPVTSKRSRLQLPRGPAASPPRVTIAGTGPAGPVAWVTARRRRRNPAWRCRVAQRDHNRTSAEPRQAFGLIGLHLMLELAPEALGYLGLRHCKALSAAWPCFHLWVDYFGRSGKASGAFTCISFSIRNAEVGIKHWPPDSVMKVCPGFNQQQGQLHCRLFQPLLSNKRYLYGMASAEAESSSQPTLAPVTDRRSIAAIVEASTPQHAQPLSADAEPYRRVSSTSA